jgi:hypothetical protein
MAVKGWTMAAVAVAVAAGTYFTLETVFPPSQTGEVDLRVVSPDSVFGNGAAGADADDVPDTAVAELAPAKTPDANDLALDEAMAPSEDQLAVTDEALAADAPEPTATPGSDVVADIDAADEAGADTLATSEDDELAEAPPATPAPTATPKPAAVVAATPRPTARPVPARTPEARVTQWWGPESEASLSLIYAGSASYTRAIVLMFNGAFQDAGAAQQHLQVRDASGKAVSGSWQVGASNRRMLLFPVAQTGLYTVSVGGGLADQNGRTLGKAQQGPVRVK